MARLLLVLLLFTTTASAQAPSRVRREGGRFWIECQSAPLEEVIREFAALSPMELWLDEGLSGKRVTVTVKGLTSKQALEELFEKIADVNYVFTLDPANPERVTKIYAGGGGGGRLGREPTVTAAEADEPQEGMEALSAEGELSQELDQEALASSPETQEGLDALREFIEQQNLENGQEPGESQEGATDLEELLQNFPELSQEPPESVPKTKPQKKEKPPQ